MPKKRRQLGNHGLLREVGLDLFGKAFEIDDREIGIDLRNGMTHLHLESRHVARSLNFNCIQILRPVLKLLISRIVAVDTLSLREKVHRAHLLRRSPIMGVFGHTYDFKVSGMLHIVAEMLADRVAILEVFLLEEAIHDRNIAGRWACPARYWRGPQQSSSRWCRNNGGLPAAMRLRDRVFPAPAGARLR